MGRWDIAWAEDNWLGWLGIAEGYDQGHFESKLYRANRDKDIRRESNARPNACDITIMYSLATLNKYLYIRNALFSAMPNSESYC